MHRADLIRAKLGELNLSKAELARRAKLNPNTITAICRGDEVMPSTLQKVGDVLGFTLAELYTPKAEIAETKQAA
jgi:transcriptional regulator with XRE-family HTH domain